ncbi:MAG: nucleotidyltransferase domain-containing protein [Candidatus Heimdallarchaeota archaeon]
MKKQNSWNAKKKLLTREKLSHLLMQEPSVIFAYIFGSFIKYSSFRDLDLAIYVDLAVIPDLASFEQNLGTRLELRIRLPVDLVLLNEAPLSLKFHVTKGQLLFSRNENIRLQFLEHTWIQYWDFQPFRRQMLWQILDPSRTTS